MTVPHIVDDTPSVVIEQKIDQNRLQSIGTDIALIVLCVVAAFVSFWDISITFSSVFTVGWVSVILYIVTTTVYRTKYDGGIFKGRQTTEYISAMETFTRYRDYIMTHSLTDQLTEWCNTYRMKDLTQLRKSIVCPYMTYEEYTEKYQNISKKGINRLDLSKQAKSAIKRANDINALELSAYMLLSSSVSSNLFGKRKALPTSGSEKRNVDFAVNYASKFIVTFICGMFAIQILSDPSLESFLQWVVRMIPVAVAFLTGEPSGYRNVVSVDTNRIDAQNQLLKLFFADAKIDLPNQGQNNEN